MPVIKERPDKNRIQVSKIVACKKSNKMFDYERNPNLRSAKKQTIIFFFCLGCGVQTGVGLRTLLTHSQQQPTALIYYGE